jgi:hypothetical protein
MLDIYVLTGLNKFSLTDEWFRNFYTSKDSVLIILHHPESLFINNQINNNYLLNFLTDSTIAIFDYLQSES